MFGDCLIIKKNEVALYILTWQFYTVKNSSCDIIYIKQHDLIFKLLFKKIIVDSQAAIKNNIERSHTLFT